MLVFLNRSKFNFIQTWKKFQHVFTICFRLGCYILKTILIGKFNTYQQYEPKYLLDDLAYNLNFFIFLPSLIGRIKIPFFFQYDL